MGSRIADAVIQALTAADALTDADEAMDDRARVWHAIYDWQEGLTDSDEEVVAKVLGTFVKQIPVGEWQRNSLGTLELVHTGTREERYA